MASSVDSEVVHASSWNAQTEILSSLAPVMKYCRFLYVAVADAKILPRCASHLLKHWYFWLTSPAAAVLWYFP